MYLSLHLGPAFLLLFAFPHVLVLLLSLSKRLQELVKDAEELVWLHLTGILTKVLYCPLKLWDQRKGGTQRGEGSIRLTAGHSRTMLYSVFDSFTGDSLGLSSLKSEHGTSSGALKMVLTQIWPTTDYSWGKAGARAQIKATCLLGIFHSTLKWRTSRCDDMLRTYIPSKICMLTAALSVTCKLLLGGAKMHGRVFWMYLAFEGSNRFVLAHNRNQT